METTTNNESTTELQFTWSLKLYHVCTLYILYHTKINLGLLLKDNTSLYVKIIFLFSKERW